MSPATPGPRRTSRPPAHRPPLGDTPQRPHATASGPAGPLGMKTSPGAKRWTVLAALAMLAFAPGIVAAQATVTLPARDRALEDAVRPAYTVGVMEGAEHEMFGRVAGVAFDRSGNLYVLDAGNHRVVVYGPDGRFLRLFGRRGAGPGEFQAPMALAVAGDEVTVLDMANNAAIVFHLDGRHLRNLPFDMEDRPGRRFAGHPQGGFVYEPMPFRMTMGDGGPEVRARDALPVLWRGTAPSATPRTLYEAPAPPAPSIRHDAAPGGQQRVRIQNPTPPMFTPAFQWTVLADGGLAVATSETYRVEIVGPDGRVRRVVERGVAPRRVVERDRERARALRQEALASGAGVTVMGGGGAPAGAVASQARAAAQEALANMTFAETVPVIQAMAADAEGRLWIRRAGDREYDRGAIDVVTADGRYLGTLREGTRIPHAFGPDRRAAYIETDDLGIQRVTVARLADWRD